MVEWRYGRDCWIAGRTRGFPTGFSLTNMGLSEANIHKSPLIGPNTRQKRRNSSLCFCFLTAYIKYGIITILCDEIIISSKEKGVCRWVVAYTRSEIH